MKINLIYYNNNNNFDIKVLHYFAQNLNFFASI